MIARAQPVASFEPSAPVLPANTLRFYFTFDRPARSEVHQQDIQLLDSSDRPLVDVFMDFGQELWSPDGKRLTVLFDPGKVKRGVEASGSELTPLTAGQTYTIALGNFRNVFRVGQPVRGRIDPRLWASHRSRRIRGTSRSGLTGLWTRLSWKTSWESKMNLAGLFHVLFA